MEILYWFLKVARFTDLIIIFFTYFFFIFFSFFFVKGRWTWLPGSSTSGDWPSRTATTTTTTVASSANRRNVPVAFFRFGKRNTKTTADRRRCHRHFHILLLHASIEFATAIFAVWWWHLRRTVHAVSCAGHAGVWWWIWSGRRQRQAAAAGAGPVVLALPAPATAVIHRRICVGRDWEVLGILCFFIYFYYLI